MRAQHILMITLFIFLVSACMSQQTPRVPADADSIPFSSVSITASIQRNNAQRVEGGFISGIIYRPGLLVEPGVIWSDGTPANKLIEVSPEELDSLVQSLILAFSDIKPVYTYSEWISGAPRNPALGMYTSDYFKHRGKDSRINIRFSGVKGDYNRSKWLVVPMKDVDAEFWNNLKKAMPMDKRFQNFFEGIKTFWHNNA